MTKITKLNLTKYKKMYDSFEQSHDWNHILSVRKMAVYLAKKYLPDKIELVYIAATLHDIGNFLGKENHEINGSKFIKNDKYLKSNLSPEDFKELCHAVKEHRASTGNPKTILAKIISDADRCSSNNSSDSLTRGYNYGLVKFPNLNPEEQFIRTIEHQVKKFCQEGTYGRRTYFPETETKLKRIYDPIFDAYKKQDWKYLRSLIKTLVK